MIVYVLTIGAYPNPSVPTAVYSTLELAKAVDSTARWDDGDGITLPCNGRGSGVVYRIVGFTVDA
jgi:hypothetical protein